MRQHPLRPGEWDGVAFRELVTDNLAHGQFRLVFAVDEITDELRRTVEFLNVHTTPGLSILALEIGYVQDEDVEILVPNIYGAEIANQKVRADQGTWDRDSLLAALEAQRGAHCAETVKSIMAWARQRGAVDRFGTGKKFGSWYPAWEDGTPRAFSAWTDGTLSIDVSYLRDRQGFDGPAFLHEVRERLAIAGLVLSAAKDAPSVQMSDIEDEGALETLLGTLAWVLEQAR